MKEWVENTLVNMLIWAAIILFCFGLSVLVIGACSQQASNPSVLPLNAYGITDKGNGWITFKIDFKDHTDTFLYHKQNVGYSGYEAITKIEEEKNNGTNAESRR